MTEKVKKELTFFYTLPLFLQNYQLFRTFAAQRAKTIKNKQYEKEFC
jgi:hypothetical protein